eukprot:tig00000350_g24305.t1
MAIVEVEDVEDVDEAPAAAAAAVPQSPADIFRLLGQGRGAGDVEAPRAQAAAPVRLSEAEWRRFEEEREASRFGAPEPEPEAEEAPARTAARPQFLEIAEEGESRHDSWGTAPKRTAPAPAPAPAPAFKAEEGGAIERLFDVALASRPRRRVLIEELPEAGHEAKDLDGLD